MGTLLDYENNYDFNSRQKLLHASAHSDRQVLQSYRITSSSSLSLVWRSGKCIQMMYAIQMSESGCLSVCFSIIIDNNDLILHCCAFFRVGNSQKRQSGLQKCISNYAYVLETENGSYSNLIFLQKYKKICPREIFSTRNDILTSLFGT